MSSEDEREGRVFSINYGRTGVLGPTDKEVGRYEVLSDGNIKVELFTVPGSAQMILRKNKPTSFEPQ